MPCVNWVGVSGQTILAAEAVNAARSIHDLLFARVEGMRLAGNFHLYQRIFLAIGPLNSFLGGDGGAGQEGEVGRDILKHHFAILRVNVFFHGCWNLGNAVGRFRTYRRRYADSKYLTIIKAL